MRNIQLPLTKDDVIRQTLKISQEIATDYGDEFALVTYDSACAKIARHRQIEESQFGQFHTLLSTYSSLGIMTEGSGGPYILNEADIIDMGSMGKFLKDNMYNGCKLGHTLLSTDMQGLHLERFIEDSGISEEAINNPQQ